MLTEEYSTRNLKKHSLIRQAQLYFIIFQNYKMNFKFLTIIFSLCAIAASGQSGFGVKAFVSQGFADSKIKNYVSLTPEASTPVTISQIAYKGATASKGLGLSMYTQNSQLFLMTDALYTETGRKFQLLSTDHKGTLLDPALDFETREANLRLALTAGYVYKNMKFGVGPELTYRLETSETLSDMVEITTNDSNLLGAFNFLVGYEFLDFLHLDVKYTYGFNDVTDEFLFSGLPMDMKKNLKQLELSLGVYF